MGRDGLGRFSQGSQNDSNRRDDEKNVIVWSAKVSPSEDRQLTIIFDQHRKLFTWQTKSDMHREMLTEGIKNIMARIPNPDPRLLDARTRDEMIDKIEEVARKHKRTAETVEVMEETMWDVLHINHDVPGAIGVLEEFRSAMENTMDRTVREKLRKYWAGKWEGVLADLRKGRIVSLKPRDQMETEEE